MDRARYRMWIGTEQSIRPRLIVQIPDGLVVGSSIKEPWKEEASSWPPRSYSCNFCRREFRSAQALGGHMNVHRRDRARLKQLHAGLGGEVMEEDEHHPNPSAVTSAGCHQPQVNPSSATVLPSTLSHRVSAPSTHGHWTETNFFSPSFSSSITGDNLKESLFCKTRSLLIVCDEKTNRNKRSRTDPMPAFFVRSSSCDQQQEAQPEALSHSSHDEELDLELRLGGAPK